MTNLPLDLILISSLNEYVFCPRRFGLQQVEGLWRDNEHTILGTLLHENVDDAGYEYEADKDVKLVFALPLYSDRYGLTGRADVIEWHGSQPIPVEYKKGKRRQYENDDVQVCAQALCLEDMFGVIVTEGFVYHATSKRRRSVTINERLRTETIDTITRARTLLQTGTIPSATYSPRCLECSLYPLCLPKIATPQPSDDFQQYQTAIWKD